MKKSKIEKKPEVKVKDLQPEKNPTGGKVAVHDISITKVVDKSTPVLTK